MPLWAGILHQQQRRLYGLADWALFLSDPSAQVSSAHPLDSIAGHASRGFDREETYGERDLPNCPIGAQ